MHQLMCNWTNKARKFSDWDLTVHLFSAFAAPEIEKYLIVENVTATQFVRHSVSFLINY